MHFPDLGEILAKPGQKIHDSNGKLQLVPSTNVDALKGGGGPAARYQVLKILEEACGEMKIQYGTFEYIGIMHGQNPETRKIRTHQQHYVRQLKAINVVYSVSNERDIVSASTPSAFMSLLGAIAWLTQTMLAICV